MSKSNNRIGELAEAAYRDVACNDTTGDTVCREAVDRKFAELIIAECAKVCEPRPWVGLTDVEWSDLYEAHHDKYNLTKQGSPDGMDYERAIEALLKEKNT